MPDDRPTVPLAVLALRGGPSWRRPQGPATVPTVRPTVRGPVVTELVGKVVRVTGLRGRFAVHAVEDGTVTCWGGPKGREAWRAFPVERIGRVDREATRRREEA